VEVGGADADAAAEAGVGEEAGPLRPGGGVERLDVPAGGAGPRARDDVAAAVTVGVARGHEDAAGEAGVGEEAGPLRPGGAVEDLDVGPGAGPRPRDDVGPAVAIDIARRHAHPAGEAGVGEEAADLQ